ncbi:MAG: hypothetical protein V3W19_11620 [Desulfatiglandales bacterium]
MTHSLHRQGPVEFLKHEFIVIIFGDAYPLASLRAKSRRQFPHLYAFLEGVFLQLGFLKIIRVIKSLRPKPKFKSATVLNSKEELRNYLEKLKEGNTGKSIIVSGVFDEVHNCLQQLGLRPHTIQLSLGYFGKTELLPRPEILEITSMCGHHMVSHRLVEKLGNDISLGKITLGEAARVMNNLCSCGIFNQARAIKILRDLTK